MTGISFMGVGSGLPVNEIINATVKAEAAPLSRLNAQKDYAKAQISAYGQLSSRLSNLRTAMLDLRGLDKFQQLAANSSNDKLFTATADHLAGATAGNYTVEVLAEARNYRQVSKSVDTDIKLSAGSLTFTKADGTPLTYKASDGTEKNIDPIIIDSDMSLEQLRQKINSNEQLKGLVSANIVNEGEGKKSRLVLNAVASGQDGRFEANFTDTELDSRDEKHSSYSQKYYEALDSGDQAAYLALHPEATRNLDALIKIDGIKASSSTNTFSNVVSGVTINVAQGAMNETSKTSTLEVKRDDTAITDNINAFVKAYNDVIININEQKKNGMAGDSTLRSIEQEMRNVLMTPTGGDMDNILARMGIKTYVERSYNAEDGASSRNGTLEIDTTELRAAMDRNFDKFALTWGGSSFLVDGQASGYAERFADLAQRLTSTTTQDGRISKGLLEIRTEGLGREVTRIDDRMDSVNLRLELLEARLVKQFSAIDGLVANLNSTGSWIGQQFASLPGYTRNNN